MKKSVRFTWTTHIFFISIVGSSSMWNNPSNSSGRKITKLMSLKYMYHYINAWHTYILIIVHGFKNIPYGTAWSTEIQDITNWRANVFLVYNLSRNRGMKVTRSNDALSVTMSWNQFRMNWCVIKIYTDESSVLLLAFSKRSSISVPIFQNINYTCRLH